jgi:probable F420-dependent oxidoreductase
VQLGVTLRNMGEESTPALMVQCAQAAESAGLESIWITDHIAIPPDDAEGSGGRYLDPLIGLSWLAGQTQHIRLGTGVINLPYRPALPTAKQIASLQELSGERLLLGVGIGWMGAEFRALGVDRRSRGRISDETLAFIRTCFANDVVEANGQSFLFKPRPPAPPIYVGGSPPHALQRAARYGEGWIPMGLSPEVLVDHIGDYRALTDAAGRPAGCVTVLVGLPLDDPARASETLARYAEVGVERVVCAMRYQNADEYRTALDRLAELT